MDDFPELGTPLHLGRPGSRPTHLFPRNPELWLNRPRALALVVCSLAWTKPLFGARLTVNAGGNLQAAIDAAQPGDTIVLQGWRDLHLAIYAAREERDGVHQ